MPKPLATILAALLAITGQPAMATATPSAETRPGSESPARPSSVTPSAMTAGTSLTWQPCPNDKIGMECADLQVPVDWRKPDDRKITLKLGRLKATGASEGSVLVAYGGPGGPGIATTAAVPEWWARLRERMDIVTWDTRGYGEQFGGLSTGLACVWTRIPIPEAPRDDAGFGRLSDTNRGFAEACRHQDPQLFANMSSADQARDMEAIRKALGGAKLNYYGASYAGFYGQDYARLFPDQIRTMVLDGTWNHSPADWSRELEEMATSNEQSMRRFFTWCATHDCQDIPGLWRKLTERARRKPIHTTTANMAYNARDLQSLALFMARQGAPAWPALARAIRKAAGQGDASDFVPARGARYPDQTTPVTECLDWPRPTTLKELASTDARLRKIAPLTGTANTLASATLTCIGWPAPVTNPPAPLPKGVPPVLGAGAWGESDAVERALAAVPGSVTIRHDGPGHTLYGFNPCARDLMNRYFTDLTLPPPNTQC
ncbi:alpha/beta fold hydrolase [Nonomuraea sp. NPDC048881]|uniref:alpha/beta fold hydrolase n=1 Tax=Nonomuraea sp. NPDC048881 TaxID=3155030 RepID=UPI0033D32AF4